MNNNFKPLIIGGSHHNTYSLVRCFGEVGVKVDCILCGCNESYVGSSKYIDILWYCETAADVIDIVESVVNEEVKRVVITATDMVASLMDLHYEEFKDKCFFFNAGNAGIMTHYMDKVVQTGIAKEVGFNVPESKSFCKGVKMIFASYPCIVKPLASIEGGKRIVICQNQHDLDACAQEFEDVNKVLIQQYLSKDEEIVLLGVALEQDVLIPGYIIKYRDVMGGTTYSSTAPIDDLDEELIDKAKNMVLAMNYEGLFGIELIKSGNDYYFIEINLRNDATSYSLAVAGVNLPLMYYKACSNNKPLQLEGSVRRICSMVEIVDFRNVLHRKVGLFDWLKQRRLSECRYFQSIEDSIPYKVAKKEFLAHISNRLFCFLKFK